MCSCSPTVFTFVIDLDRAFNVDENGICKTNDIEDNPGIDDTYCTVYGQEELDEEDPVTEIVSIWLYEYAPPPSGRFIYEDKTYIDIRTDPLVSGGHVHVKFSLLFS